MPRSDLALSACLSAGLALAAGTAAWSDSPAAMITYSVDGAAPASAILASSLAQNGNASFTGVIAPPGAGWQLQVSMSSDFQPNPNANLFGLLVFSNETPVTRTVLITVDVAICPHLDGGSLVGGTTSLTLISTDAGSFSCAGSPAVVTFLANGESVGTLFSCPFALTAGGSGTLTSSAQFGLPGPNGPGPAILESIGMRQHLAITGMDTAQVQFNYLLIDPSGIVPCEADLNGDGQISGADLAYLFTQWGGDSSCGSQLDADLDLDGTVGTADLQLLLGAWGESCP